MSKQLVEKANGIIEKLEIIKKLASAFPEASDEVEYAISNNSILAYIPYNLSLLAIWQEKLNMLGFTRENIWSANEYGITVHENYDKDCCRMVNKELDIAVALWLCPGHPMASVKKGNIPQL